MLFRSKIQTQAKTRLTTKLRRTDLTKAEATTFALSSIKKHLGLGTPTEVSNVIRAQNMFLQMEVRYKSRIESIETQLAEKYP